MSRWSWFRFLALGLAVGIGGVMLAATPLGLALEEGAGLDWLFTLRGARPAPAEAVVVTIDKVSADRLGLPNEPHKWPRALHARLIDNLARHGAAAIAFDVIFDEPRVPEHDRLFAAAVERAGNVVLFEYLKKDITPMRDAAGRPAGELVVERRVPPIPELARAAAALAPFPLPKVPVKVSQFWTFKDGGGDRATLPVVVLQLFALPAYDEFLGLLRQASPTHAAGLPQDAREVIAGRSLQALAQRLHHLFRTQPALAERMLSALAAETPGRSAALIRSLIELYRGGDSRYLNFYGLPRSITTVPYHQVLEASADAARDPAVPDVRGKAVFVGFSERLQPEQKDGFYTVYSQASGLDVSGVEIAATAFANLLENMPVRPVAPLAQLALIFLWGLVVGALCRRLPALPAVGASVGLCGLYVAVAYLQFRGAAIWLPLMVPVFVQAPLALFAGVLWNYLDVNRERRNIRAAFGYYLPDKVVDRLARDISHVQTGGQMVYGICLSTDAERYTTLSEGLHPEELGAVMNRYYEAVFRPVRDHGGMISDVVGDAMLAIWAAARSDAHLRKQACLAALETARAVDRFNASGGAAALPTRIGLHAGEMLLGNIGAIDHYEYRAVGDIVNTASRIQGLNKVLGTHILASDETLAGTDGLLARELGEFVLAGKSRPLTIHELLCLADEASDRQRELCAQFGRALAAFRSRHWSQAGAQFAALLDDHPDDGPARFYLRVCGEYEAHPPADASGAVISVERK